MKAVAQDAATDERGLPVLWHLKVSNYNEKARWALDYKQVPHLRRAAIPGRHMALAKQLTGGRTLPVLVLDGRPIGDSTKIIQALEERYPQRPLYPADAGDRTRALALEDYFDEELGPHARLLFIHHVLPDPRLMLSSFAPDLRGVRYLFVRAGYRGIRRGVTAQFGISDATVSNALDKIAAAGERFRAARGSGDYLVGGNFTVADLTLAALIAPLVAPEQFPYPQPQRDHPRVAPLREALAREGLLDWTREMYARHRGRSVEVRP